MARDAFESHECKESPRICPGHDIGCDEAHHLMQEVGHWEALAVEAIVKRGLDILLCTDNVHSEGIRGDCRRD